jgi:hypothetical protein
MNHRLRRGVAIFLRPPLEVARFVVGNLYQLFFGRYEIRLSRKAEDELAQDVRRELSFLFQRPGADIVSDDTIPHPRPFNYAIVIAVLPDLFLRFIRGRGELRVQVAPRSEPGNWAELPWVLNIIDGSGQLAPKGLATLQEVAPVLKARMAEIATSQSVDQYGETAQQLREMRDSERVVIKQWEMEINRRLYPDR